MSEEDRGSTWKPRDEIAMCSGTIAADGTVTTVHGSAAIESVTADVDAATITMHFVRPFDENDNVYFAIAFAFDGNGQPQAFIATSFAHLSVTVTAAGGPYPGTGPWTFAFLSVTTPAGGSS